MKISKFVKDEFGTLTTITSPKTGKTMFLASEVGRMWGHTNMTSVSRSILNNEEVLTIKKSQYPDLFRIFVSEQILPVKAQRIQLITESALYKLALASNLEKAKPFRDWVTSEVLPSIRENGYYSIADNQSIGVHINISVQKKNSKEINSKNYVERGIEGVIEYNKKSCLLHSGKTTKEVKEYGKAIGLKSNERNSAKEVLRHTAPEVACAMSFTDSLVKKGFDLETVSELSKTAAIPLFKGMIELGIRPAELNE